MTTTATDVVEVEARDGGVAVVRMNRPERLNALNPDLIQGLNDYFADFKARLLPDPPPSSSPAPAAPSAPAATSRPKTPTPSPTRGGAATPRSRWSAS